MKKLECEKWARDHEAEIRVIVPDAEAVKRTDKSLLVRVPTVRQAKAVWHKQRDLQAANDQKRKLRGLFPDLARITFQGPMAVEKDGWVQLAHGNARTN